MGSVRIELKRGGSSRSSWLYLSPELFKERILINNQEPALSLAALALSSIHNTAIFNAANPQEPIIVGHTKQDGQDCVFLILGQILQQIKPGESKTATILYGEQRLPGGTLVISHDKIPPPKKIRKKRSR